MKKYVSLLLCLLLLTACSAGTDPTNEADGSMQSSSSASAVSYLPPGGGEEPPPIGGSLHSLPTPQTHPEYALEPLEEGLLQQGGLSLQLDKTPETPAEQVVASYWATEFFGSYRPLIWLSTDPLFNEEYCAARVQDYENGENAFQSLHIRELRQLSITELETATGLQDNGLLLGVYYADSGFESYSDFGQAFAQAGHAVVYLDIDTLYTDYARQMGPQVDDGVRQIYYLLSPDAEGNYHIQADTYWMGGTFLLY